MSDPVKGAGAQGQPVKLTARELRVLAETADGLRDQGGHIVIDNGKARWRKKGETGGVPVLEITPSGEVNDPENFKLHTAPAVEPSVDIRVAFDAMFWSPSALRKFVFPYYAAYEDSGRKVDEIIRRFGSQSQSNDGAVRQVVALAHSPSSDPTDLTTSLKALAKVSGTGVVEHLEAFPALDMLR